MECRLCPRSCGADRTQRRGVCGADSAVRIARAAAHHWEEPCISGTRGSGAVFFVGCPLGCVFCQNREISTGENRGTATDAEGLARIFLSLQQQACHNLNLVTATPYTDACLAALDRIGDKRTVPVVWNSGGYETKETVRRLSPAVSVFLPDYKFSDPALGSAFAHAPDYPAVALDAIREMVRITGKPVFDDDGILVRGTMVRHLVLPGHRADSLQILTRLYEEFGNDEILLSLMWQYTPNGTACEGHPELGRRVVSFEYRSVADRAAELGFSGYLQERSSADRSFTPPFDGTGTSAAADTNQKTD